MNPFAAIGGILNGALYLVCVFVAALVWQQHVTVLLAVAALGVTFLSYLAQVCGAKSSRLNIAIHLASIGLGIAAGLSLIVFLRVG